MGVISNDLEWPWETTARMVARVMSKNDQTAISQYQIEADGDKDYAIILTLYTMYTV